MPDVVISFDSTGSMAAAISQVRMNVEKIITQLFDSVDDLRMSIINHGSYCDGERMIDIHDLTDDKQSLISFLKRTRNTSGCDMRHASYEVVLDTAIHLNWQSSNRALILIGDCEPHPLGYTQGIPKGVTIDWKDRARILNEVDIEIFPIQALNRSQHTHFYTYLAKLSSTPKLDLMQFADIAEYLTAVIYSQKSAETVINYADKLQVAGLFNNNLAKMFNDVLGEQKYQVHQNLNRQITRYAGDIYDQDAKLREVDPARFQVLFVQCDQDIKSFVNDAGARFQIGRGFYELTKPETVQERKEVVLRHKTTGDMFSGSVARDMIGLPYGQRGTVRPRYGFEYDVFIQSTSANRKLKGHTRFLYEAK